ncbi:MAG: hypothetical protein IPG93_20925 [Burkholderiales bacterium]|nr:hypothetical protein [Burkholderiales bacterium]
MSTESGNHLIDRAAMSTDLATEHALGAAQRGVAALRDGRQQMVDRAHVASDAAVGYIKDEPVKSLLIAAAAGAVLMGLLGWLTRARSDRY